MEMKTRFGNAWNAADDRGRRLCAASKKPCSAAAESGIAVATFGLTRGHELDAAVFALFFQQMVDLAAPAGRGFGPGWSPGLD
jgi:hypothetical protein